MLVRDAQHTCEILPVSNSLYTSMSKKKSPGRVKHEPDFVIRFTPLAHTPGQYGEQPRQLLVLNSGRLQLFDTVL